MLPTAARSRAHIKISAAQTLHVLLCNVTRDDTVSNEPGILRYPAGAWGAVSSVARKLEYEITFAINETERALLGFLGVELRQAGGSVVLSASGISQSLSITEQTARRTCRSLAEKGLISVSPKTREDGSRAANEYRITLLGWKTLESKPLPRPSRLPERRKG